MPGRTLILRLRLPSVRVPMPRVVRLPDTNGVKVNPLLLILLAAIVLYASFENTKIGMAEVRRDIYQSLGGLAEGLKANLTQVSTMPAITPAPQTVIIRDNDSSELVKSLSLSVSRLNDEVSRINSLGRYYSSKLELTATVKVAAAAAAQKSYSEVDDPCMKLSDSEDGGREKNRTNCRNAKSAYYWVRDNVKYEPAYESGYSRGDVQLPSETLAGLMGGSADHAVLLVSLLRSRGIDAYLVTMPDADYMIAAARVTGLPDVYPGSISWRTMTSTGMKQPSYEYYGTQKDLVLLDPACGDCLFGKLREGHKDLKMDLMAYFNRTGT